MENSSPDEKLEFWLLLIKKFETWKKAETREKA